MRARQLLIVHDAGRSVAGCLALAEMHCPSSSALARWRDLCCRQRRARTRLRARCCPIAAHPTPTGPRRVAQLLWRYNREAVALRIAYLNSARPGGEAHTVLTTDIPGVEYGTLAHRIEGTVLRVLPQFIKRRITVLPGPRAADLCARPARQRVPEQAPARRLPRRGTAGLAVRGMTAQLWLVPSTIALHVWIWRAVATYQGVTQASLPASTEGRMHRSERAGPAAAPPQATRRGPPDGALTLCRAARRRPDLPRGGQQRGAGAGRANARDGRRRGRARAARHRPHLGAHAGRRRRGRGGAARPEQRCALAPGAFEQLRAVRPLRPGRRCAGVRAGDAGRTCAAALLACWEHTS